MDLDWRVSFSDQFSKWRPLPKAERGLRAMRMGKREGPGGGDDKCME